MTVTLDRTIVEPGGSVAIAVTIHNGRSAPAIFSLDECSSPVQMHASMPPPVGPSGRSWDGIAGEFKDYALTKGNRYGRDVYATPTPCGPVASTQMTLAPGSTATASMTWTAAFVKGVAALPGEVPIDVGLTSTAPPSAEQLTVQGTIRIAGEPPKMVTEGEALDAMLADRRFVGWLSEQPTSTWSVANMLLTNFRTATGIGPAGSFWEIDLFRENGVRRNWAIGLVDPLTGELRTLTFCNAPCDR